MDQRSAVPVPAELGHALNLVMGATLEFEIFVDQDDKPFKPSLPIIINPSTNAVEPFKATLPLGSHSIWINQVVVDPFYGRVNIARTQPDNFNVVANEPLNFSHVQLQALPDDDSDGVPNVSELLARTDPKNPDEKPVVSDVTQLELLAIEGISFQPPFNPQHPTYSGRLLADVTEIVITAKPKRSSASISINGVSVDAGQPTTLAVPPRISSTIEVVVDSLGETAKYFVHLIHDDVRLSASPRPRSVELAWKGAAQSYTVYRSTEPCDVLNNSRCNDDAVYVDAKSPFLVTGLDNGTRYYFRVVAEYLDRATIPTNTVVAIPRPAVLDCCVGAMDVTVDGTAYLGGTFTRASSLATHGMVVDNTTGEIDNRFPPIHGTVNAAAPDGAGGWYVGGQFTRVDNSTRYNLVHILGNGDVDPNWHPEVRIGFGEENRAYINAIIVSGTNVVIGGFFDNVSGYKRGNLAAISVAGEIVPWNDIGTDDEVRSLAANGETVFVGGQFTRLGNQSRLYLAAVSLSDGSLLPWNADSAFKQPQGYSYPTVSALAVADGILYIGGVFDLVAGDMQSLFALSTANATLQSWAPRLRSEVYRGRAEIFSLAVAGKVVYVAGSFTHVNDFPWSYVAALAVDDGGSLLTSWKPAGITEYSDNLSISRLSVSGGIVYLGGWFKYPTNSFDVIPVGFDGNPLPKWSAIGFSPGPINAVVATENQIFIGGGLGYYHSQPRKRLAAYAADGDLLPWNPSIDDQSTGPATAVDALRLISDTVYVGGHFESITDTPVRNLAALNRISGKLEWSPALEWNPPHSYYTRSVNALVVQETRLYVGGNFATVDGANRQGLAAFDNHRLLDWGSQLMGNTTGGFVTTLHAWDSSVLVSASDSSNVPDIFVADQAGNRMDWAPAVELVSVSSFATSNDAVFLAQSSQQTLPTHTVIAFNKTGNSKLSWVANPTGQNVKLFYSRDVLYLAGDFSSVSNETRHHLAAARVPGGAVLDWQPHPNAPVKAISSYQDKIYVGGDFDSIDGVTTGSFAIQPAYSGGTP